MSQENQKVSLFGCKSPCGNCPYRKDAPLKLWDKSEFKRLLESEQDMFGSVYMCHKSNGSICVGWLIDQDKRHLPSIALRLELSRNDVTREYLDNLSSPAELFASIKEMIRANFPSLLK